MDETSHQYVMAKEVTGTRAAPRAHVTLMFCDEGGNTAMYANSEALPPSLRLVDREDTDQMLANLGYIVVEPETVRELQVIGMAAAIAWYRANLSVTGEQDYANNNWGLFAAQYLVDSVKVPAPQKRSNHVPWKQHEARAAAEARRERAAYQDYLFG
jgi:hypothetical protein